MSEARLRDYLAGWKHGCFAGLCPDYVGEDFQRGWDHGREDAAKAMKWAEEFYKTTLSVLPVENEKPKRRKKKHEQFH